MREFPILWPSQKVEMLEELRCPRSVPWSVVEPAREQAMRNHGQTLERLAERGGLSPVELAGALSGLSWEEVGSITEAQAVAVIMGSKPSVDGRISVEGWVVRHKETGLWWRPKACGYTREVVAAAILDQKTAQSWASRRSPDSDGNFPDEALPLSEILALSFQEGTVWERLSQMISEPTTAEQEEKQ